MSYRLSFLLCCFSVCGVSLGSRSDLWRIDSHSDGLWKHVFRPSSEATTSSLSGGELDDAELLETFLSACVRHWNFSAPKMFVPTDFLAKLLLKSQSGRFVSSLVLRNDIRSDRFDSIHFREPATTQLIIAGSRTIVTNIFREIMELQLLSLYSHVVLVCLDCTDLSSVNLIGHDVLSHIVFCFPKKDTTMSTFDTVTLIFDYRTRKFVSDQLGRWSKETGFTLTRAAASDEKFLKLGNSILSVLAAQENTPYLIRINNSLEDLAIGGYTGDLIHVLSEVMEFRFNVVFTAKTEYGNSKTGLIAEFVEKKYDVGVGVFSMSMDRLSAVDFTASIAETPTTFVLQRPSKLLGTIWNLCTRPFTAALWWAVLVLCVISSLFLAATVRWSRRAEKLPDDSWIPAIMSVWLMQGDDYIPTMPSAKTTITLTSFACWILLSIYNSFLVTFLALDTTPIMTSLEQLAKSGVKVGVAKGVVALELLKTSTDDDVESMESRIVTTVSHKSGMDLVCSNPRFAQLVSVPVAFDYAERRQKPENGGQGLTGAPRPCQLYALKEVFFVDRYHFITQKGDALSSRLSRGLMRLRESGVLTRLAKNNHVKMRETAVRAGDLQTWAIITLTHMAIPFACLLVGVALSFAALLLEMTHFRFCHVHSRKFQPAACTATSSM